MLTPRIDVAKFLYSGAILCTFLVSRAPAQKLEWIEPLFVSQPAPRTSAAMVYDPAMGETLLYGGNTYDTLFGDTWAFSKAKGWRKLIPVSSPPPLEGASLAYDAKTGTVVLFGGGLAHIGESIVSSNETWTWDRATWTQQFPPISPPARNWNSPNGMVFDSAIGMVVMFGGGGDTSLDDTWEWDGLSKTWTQKYPVHNPSPRSATLAYDEAANQVVLFGGSAVGYNYYQDTWTYNGVDWVQHEPPTIPPARSDNALAFDPILKRVVMFGGLAGPCEDCGEPRLNDTWVWGGINWTQVKTPLIPAPSSGATLTYDATTKGMLLFGGWTSDFQFTGATWFFWLF